MYQLRFLNTTSPSQAWIHSLEPGLLLIAFQGLELDRLLEREVEARFRWDLDLLTFCDHLRGAADCRPRRSSNGRPPAAACQRTDNSSQGRRAAYHLRGTSAARTAGPRDVGSGGIDGLAVDGDVR